MKTRNFSDSLRTAFFLAAVVGLASCGAGIDEKPPVAAPRQPQAVVPASWILPENRAPGDAASSVEADAVTPSASQSEDEAAEKALAPQVDRIFGVSRAAVEQGLHASQGAGPGSRPDALPSDWVPWHMEFFSTDLSVTASRLMGVLTVVGNPWVQAFWRRQNEPSSHSAAEIASQPDGVADSMTLEIHDSPDSPSDPKEGLRQIDTMVRTAMATGKVNDEATLREGLTSEFYRFREIAGALASADRSAPGSQWWVSRFRVDLIVAASGSLGVSPSSVGGNLRMRFEWQRISPKAGVVPRPGAAPAQVSDSMSDFVVGMKADLEAAAQSASAQGSFGASGVYPYQIRIGLGMTASGTVGIAKSSAELLGHVYFATNVSKPSVNPPGHTLAPTRAMLLLEKAPHSSHLALATQSGVAIETSQDDVVYRIAHEKFVEGLKKAMHMGSFFAGRAARPTSSVWKLYQMYVGFDVSVTGTTGAISLAGNSSDEIDFYNGNF